MSSQLPYLAPLVGYQLQARVPFLLGSTAVPVPASGIATALNLLAQFALNNQQALRIVKGSYANCNDLSSSGQLRCLAITIQVLTSIAPIFVFPGVYTGTVMGATGEFTIASVDEVLLGTDLVQQGAAQGVSLVLEADIQNLDAVNPHNANVMGAGVYEIWQKSVGSIGRYP